MFQTKQLDRIAAALERIADNLDAAQATASQGANLHSELFTEARTLFEPLLKVALERLAAPAAPAATAAVASERLSAPVREVFERAGVRLVASPPNEIEIPIEELPE